jgi:hypothetical protein
MSGLAQAGGRIGFRQVKRDDFDPGTLVTQLLLFV